MTRFAFRLCGNRMTRRLTLVGQKTTHLPLANEDDENEHPLEKIENVRQEPDVVGASGYQGDEVQYPGCAHHHHYLHVQEESERAQRKGQGSVKRSYEACPQDGRDKSTRQVL